MKKVYIQIKAGLGNQMFQYAFGRALSLRRNEELVLDTSWYNNQPKRDTYRDFLLSKLNIKATIGTEEEIARFHTSMRKLLRKIHRRLIYKKDFVYHRGEAYSKRTYFEGHWGNEKYFKEFASLIRKELTPRESISSPSQTIKESIDKLKTEHKIPISIHVRRGDCVTNPHAATYQGTIDTSYYDTAREFIFSKLPKEHVTFFVFSDDIEWAKVNIKTESQTIYVSNPSIPDYEELHLMSLCSHHIIANSSYSWWGAWLNLDQKKIVIAPKQWTKDTSFDTRDVYPSEWIRI